MRLRDSQPEHFDAVVVGSGFGGAVAAFRLAEAGLETVLVLERGQPYPPGSFPRTPRGMRENFWDPATGLHGLFDLWSFPHVSALVAAGLGGGSLIYANVILRKPEDSFSRVAARPGRLSSRTTTGSSRCSRPRPIRPISEPYASTPKTLAFAEAAEAAGLEVEHPPLAVTFADERGDRARPAARARRQPARASAASPAASSASATWAATRGPRTRLDFNYLSAAKREGAEIRTCCEAVAVSPAEQRLRGALPAARERPRRPPRGPARSHGRDRPHGDREDRRGGRRHLRLEPPAARQPRIAARA